MSDDVPMTPDEPEPDDDLFGNLLGNLGGGGGFGDLLAQAQSAMAASQEAANAEVEGTAGGGMVKITATGAGEVLDVAIRPEVVDPDDIETLQDLIVAAFRDVHARIGQLHAQAMGGLDPSALVGDLGSAFSGGLPGLLGGDDAEGEWLEGELADEEE